MSQPSQILRKRLIGFCQSAGLSACTLALITASPLGCATHNTKDRWVAGFGGLTSFAQAQSSQAQSSQSISGDVTAQPSSTSTVQTVGHQQLAAGGHSPSSHSNSLQQAYAVNPVGSQTVSPSEVVPAGFGHRALYDPQCPTLHHCNPASIGRVGDIGSNCGCSPNGSCAAHAECGPQWPNMPQAWDQQEYIFDGGDKEPDVVVLADGSEAGLQVEDTVIHYQTEDGRLLVDASCRTKIYSPRFAAVRKITNVATNEMSVAALNAAQPAGPSTINDKLPSSTVMLGQQIRREDGVKLMEEFRDRNRGVPAEGIIPFVAINDAQRAMEDTDFIHSGIIQEDQWAKIVKGAQAALEWSTLDSVEVMIGADEAQIVKDSKLPAELHLYELKGARVRICKVASDTLANPGDEVTFTIRFDNAGEQPIKNIVILDSLSPRLEYVDGSQTSSIANIVDAPTFSTTPNEAGSAVLKWELNSELKPGEGGWIRFRCKVR